MGPVGKVRTPLGVIGFSIITLGIYGLYWQYVTFKEMKENSNEGIGGGLAVGIAIFLLGIPNIFLMPGEVGKLFKGRGEAEPVTAMTGFWVLLPLIGGLVWLFKTQGRL